MQVWQRAVRRLSSAYRGSAGNNHDEAIRRVRAERAKRKSSIPGQGMHPTPKRAAPLVKDHVVLRSKESIFSRYLEAVVGVHALGTVAFCGVVLRGAEAPRAGSEHQSPEPSSLLRYLAVAAAVATSSALFFTAVRFRRRRVVEIRVSGPLVKLFARPWTGFHDIRLVHAVPSKDLCVDFQKLRKAATFVPIALSGAVAAANAKDVAVLRFSIRNSDNVAYTASTRELSILDAQAIESVSVHLPDDRDSLS
jgi:hypothetical protein